MSTLRTDRIETSNTSGDLTITAKDANSGVLTIKTDGRVLVNNSSVVYEKATTVSNLGTPTAGHRNLVTDATSNTFYSVVSGGGSIVVPVFADGSDWRIG
jgi:hypothetical protein